VAAGLGRPQEEWRALPVQGEEGVGLLYVF